MQTVSLLVEGWQMTHEDSALRAMRQLASGGSGKWRRCRRNHCAAINVFASTISPFSSARQKSGSAISTNSCTDGQALQALSRQFSSVALSNYLYLKLFYFARKGGRPVARIKERKEESISIPVEEAVSTYLQSAHFKELQPGTQQTYKAILRKFAAWCSSHAIVQDNKTKEWTAAAADEPLLLHQVNGQVVRLFLEYHTATAKAKKSGAAVISTYTLKNCVRILKNFLNWCSCDPEYERQVSYIVVQRIELPTVVKVIIQPFNDEQIHALFEACDKQWDRHLQLRDRAILAVMLDTGIRARELVTLKIGDVSLDAKDAYIRVLGKRQKWGEVGLGEQSRRLLQQYLRKFRVPTLESEIRRKYRNIPPKQLKSKLDQALANQVVFMSREARPLTTSGLLQTFKRLGRIAHIEGVRCSPHTMRHSFAVRFWRRTHDIRTLSDLLRHSSIATTQEYLKSIQQAEARIGAPSVLDELDK